MESWAYAPAIQRVMKEMGYPNRNCSPTEGYAWARSSPAIHSAVMVEYTKILEIGKEKWVANRLAEFKARLEATRG